MKKRIVAMVIAAVLLAGMLGGCAGYDELMYGLYTMLGGEVESAADSQPDDGLSAPDSIPAPASTPAPSADSDLGGQDDLPQSSSASVPAPLDVGFTLNEAMVNIALMTNGEFKEIFPADMPVDAQIIMGGIPYLTYYEESGMYLTVELWEEGEDLMTAWENAERGPSGMPEYNCFPDSYPVSYVILSGNADTAMDYLFPGEGERSYENICLLLGQDPGMMIDPADPPEMENSEMYQAEDIPYCVFTHNGVNIRMNYSDEGGSYVLSSVNLYTDDPYGFFA